MKRALFFVLMCLPAIAGRLPAAEPASQAQDFRQTANPFQILGHQGAVFPPPVEPVTEDRAASLESALTRRLEILSAGWNPISNLFRQGNGDENWRRKTSVGKSGA